MEFFYDNIYVKRKILVQGGAFELPQYGLFAIKGKNGVGKSLLLNNLFDIKRKEGISSILVDQSSNRIIENETIYYNIWGEQKKTFRNEKIESLLAHSAKELSGGEKRLICLFRGLLSDANLVFIDEPTNDLDFISTQKLIELLCNLKTTKLIIVITHDDRIDKYLDGTLIITERELKSDSVKIENNKAYFPIEKRKTKETNKYIKRQFRFGYFSILTALILLTVLLFSGLKIRNFKSDKIESIPQNQVDIFVPVSEYYLKNKESTLPISYMRLFDNENSILDTAKELPKNDEFKRGDVNFFLDLKSTENYTVYDLEYYDTKLHESYIVMNDYFTEDQINGTVSTDSNYKLVYCSVKLNNGYTFADFVHDNNFKQLMDGNYYIRSNDVIELINSANRLNIQKESISLIVGTAVIMLVLEIIYYCLYLSSKSITIRIYRNMGFDDSVIKNSITQKINTQKSMMIFFSFLMIIILYQTLVEKIGSLIWIIWLLTGLCYLFNMLLVTIIRNKKILKILDWRYRC